MSSFYTKVRGALQRQLRSVLDLPEVAWEGVKYTPVPGRPFVAPVLVPVSIRPVTMGSITFLHEGLFEIGVVYPYAQPGFPGGTGVPEEMADRIRERYRPENVLEHEGTYVRISFSERRMALLEPDWIRVPVSVSWFSHDTE